MKEKFLNGLNWLLVANTGFVFFSFCWLVVAVMGRSLDVPLGLDLWLRLWEPIFTPAIGILMGGAILSGLISWISRRFFPADESGR
ncbi:hypothetical protein [Trichothermofontia sp.]